MCAGFVDDEGHPDVEAYQAYEAEFGGEEGPTVKIRRKKIGNAAAIMHKMRVMYGLEEDADGDAYQAYEAECEDDEPESARKRQPRKAHPAPSVAMLMEAEKLAAQAKKAYEKVKRQKAKEALKNELNVAERKRRPRKAHPAPSVAMLKEAEKLSKQASKLHEKAKKQEAKEAVAAAAADAKETAAYVAQLEKELVKARAAVKKKIRQLNAAEGCLR
jgi:hypothetical protein